jgi:hypothetical protein
MFDLRRGRSLVWAVNIPIELYESSIGRYFICNAPNLSLSAGIYGNFLNYSHVFNIITDDENTITILTEVIENNKKSLEFQQARNEYIGKKEYKKEMERKWINKEISYQEYNNAII